MINISQLLHYTCFQYRSLGSASQPAKNLLKVLHLNVRHSSYDTVKFLHAFSMGKSLKCSPLKFMFTHVYGEAKCHTPTLNMHDFSSTLLQVNKTVFVCVKQSRMSKRAGATVTLYLEDKWPTYIQGKNFFSLSRGKAQIITAQNLLSLVCQLQKNIDVCWMTFALPNILLHPVEYVMALPLLFTTFLVATNFLLLAHVKQLD